MIVDTRSTVETPEGVDFQFVIAGPGKRAIAFFFDILVRVAVFAITLLLFLFVIGLSFGDASTIDAMSGFGLFALFVTIWMYGAVWEGFWNGQTPGKRWCQLRVVRTNGTPIGWFEAFGRNLLLAADIFWVIGAIPMCTAALFSMTLTRKMQRLGDLVCDTMVIDESREFGGRSRGILHRIEAIPRAHCTGRFHVPERTLAVIERLFDNDRLISEGRREEIAKPLAKILIQRLGYDSPGPADMNPNEYFVKTPIRHVHFLKQVLKTFSVDDSPDSKEPRQKKKRFSRQQNPPQDIENLDADFIDTSLLADAVNDTSTTVTSQEAKQSGAS